MLQDLAAEGVATASTEDLLRAAHAAALWSADLDRLMAASEAGGPGLQHYAAVSVLAESLRAMEQAAHLAAVAGQSDTRTQKDLRACLARFSIAFEPLLRSYVDVLRRLHRNAIAVDPTRV